MVKLSNETVSCIEQIIIALLEENRYSLQVSKSISFISKIINKPITKLDKSIDSLRLIDSYLGNLNSRNEIDLETLLSITIYLSQVVILSFDGIWIIEDEKTVYPGRSCYSDEDKFLTCSIKIQVHNSCDYVIPHHILMINSGKRKSDLNQIVNSLRFKKITKETYVLSRLDSMIQNGDDFYSKIPFLVSTLSTKLDIPMRQLTKSINSLKFVDKAIRLNGKKYLILSKTFDDLFFLSLVVYVGEVIIKNVMGKWEVNVERVFSSNTLQYHWTLKIYNSSDQELNGFIRSVERCLGEMTYMNCDTHKMVRYFLSENQNNHEYTWRDADFNKIDRSKRVWRRP